jgi:hypothetical protein
LTKTKKEQPEKETASLFPVATPTPELLRASWNLQVMTYNEAIITYSFTRTFVVTNTFNILFLSVLEVEHRLPCACWEGALPLEPHPQPLSF